MTAPIAVAVAVPVPVASDGGVPVISFAEPANGAEAAVMMRSQQFCNDALLNKDFVCAMKARGGTFSGRDAGEWRI